MPWKSLCCVQERTSKIQWRKYSGNPSVVCKTILWKLSGSDTREIFLSYAGIHFENSMAQILGKSFCYMQECIVKIQWLRYSGNLSAVCRNIFWKFNGSDTREMLLLSAGTYFENSMAQILWKSFCCAREHIIKIPWSRYQGNPSAVCMIILWRFSGSDTRDILLLYAGIYYENLMAQILERSVCCMQPWEWKNKWLRYSG